MRITEKIDVSILVVSYNTRTLTLACLDSISAETHAVSSEIIVIDNASGDGSCEAIAAHPSKPILVALSRNIGFAAGNNLAAEQARSEYLLLINPDTVVKDRAIERLLAFARANPHAGIWGGRTLFGDGALNPASCWGRMTPWNLLCRASGLTGLLRDSTLFNGEAYGGWRRDAVREVDIVSGCFMLIRRELWERLDGFDPLFFMYGEEADLCLRAQALGARPMITPGATIIHYGGASEKVRADKMVRLLAAKASLIIRHWHGSTRRVGLTLHALWPLSRMLATHVLATLTGDAKRREAAEVWSEIWRRRGEWRHGYTRAPAKLSVAVPIAAPA